MTVASIAEAPSVAPSVALFVLNMTVAVLNMTVAVLNMTVAVLNMTVAVLNVAIAVDTGVTNGTVARYAVRALPVLRIG